jgi:hypothetical protein
VSEDLAFSGVQRHNHVTRDMRAGWRMPSLRRVLGADLFAPEGRPVTGPAVPPGGEELREAIGRVLDAHTAVADGVVTRVLTTDLGYLADAVLALPAVRDALAAQEKLRSYANEPAPTSEQLRDLVIRNRELEAKLRRAQELVETAQRLARKLRRLLAGGDS